MIFRPLGQGAFGEVYEGCLICGEHIVRVAIKTLPKTATKQAINDFEMEALIMTLDFFHLIFVLKFRFKKFFLKDLNLINAVVF